MGQLKFERLTLMAEECKRQANRTKRLADNVTNVDENEDDEENEEGEKEEEEVEDDDGSEDEACAGIPRENSDEEEDEVREGKFEETLFRKAYPDGYLYHGLSFAFQWTNEPRHLNPGSVREYDRCAYARVSPTTQPRGEGERSTKTSSEGSANLPVLG
ncbi:hypothetical protein BcDW1_1679 [Botrytis cinerea BcDW1]|uniref:Uncharacterized protein n=1 Tax=Botryotinia fuckeliana (strain BcDW1) TaxID=1290391 RepID=M7V0J0_BOTF1|nr:hypothetical protein BcDW1_1679 [Botrytis cinerea BcDW1]